MTVNDYDAAVRASAPLGYWPLGVDASDALGTFDGAPAGVTFGVPGPGDGLAAGFTWASGASVVMSPAPLYGSSDALTIEWWSNPNDTAPWANGCVEWSDSPEVYGVMTFAGSPMRCAYWNEVNYFPDVPLDLGIWHHWALVWSSTDQRGRLYRDGWLYLDTDMPQVLGVGGYMLLGWSGFAGDLAHVAVYSRALPAPEIGAHWQAMSTAAAPSRPTMASFSPTDPRTGESVRFTITGDRLDLATQIYFPQLGEDSTMRPASSLVIESAQKLHGTVRIDTPGLYDIGLEQWGVGVYRYGNVVTFSDPTPPVRPSQFQRSAWLVLGDMMRPLDDLVGGWVCTELDLGGADVRDVTNSAPDRHGIDDRTQFLGGRVVTASITAVPDGRVPLDDIVQGFGPYMDPAARPELHFRTMSADGLERVLTLRASAWSAPMGVPISREFQLSWVAPDPIIRSAQVNTETAWSGSSVVGGRAYDLSFDRSYPPDSGGPVTGSIVTKGSLRVAPLLRIYGPISDPQVWLFPLSGHGDVYWLIQFQSGYRIDAGHFVELDCDKRTIYFDGDTDQNQLGLLDWVRSVVWPELPVAPDSTAMALQGTNTAGSTQVQAIWQDRYLS